MSRSWPDALTTRYTTILLTNFVPVKEDWLTENADHVAFLDGFTQLLIDGVTGDHLIAIIRMNAHTQLRGCNPASILTGCLQKKIVAFYNFEHDNKLSMKSFCAKHVCMERKVSNRREEEEEQSFNNAFGLFCVYACLVSNPK